MTSIWLGTTQNSGNSLDLNYGYDSFGNIRQQTENGGTPFTFAYDAHNRLTSGYGQSYGYDAAGRLTSFEGASYTAYRGHGITKVSGTQRYYYDANGNLTNRRWGLGNQQTLSWDAENHLSGVSGSNGYSENYLYNADGQRVRRTNNAGSSTFYISPNYEVTNEDVWVDDAIPGGATVIAAEDGWNWQSGNPVSGEQYHFSPGNSGLHQHYFYNAQQPMKVNTGDVLYAYVYLDGGAQAPSQVVRWH